MEFGFAIGASDKIFGRRHEPINLGVRKAIHEIHEIKTLVIVRVFPGRNFPTFIGRGGTFKNSAMSVAPRYDPR